MNDELAEELRDYSTRKDGRYVEGVVMDVDESKRGGIKIDVETPTKTFTDCYNKPSPEEGAFEEIADEYGQGLVDINALEGNTVWCKERGNDWEITIQRGYLGRLKERLELADSDTAWKTFVAIVLAPLHATLISHQQHEGEHWRHKRSPSDHDIAWKDGVFSAIWFAIFWLSIVALVILLI